MKTLKITTNEIGRNGHWDLRNKINDFVNSEFALLYEGAVRMQSNIVEDYYAPNRIQINNTRLHAAIGLKYADGHKYSDDAAPSEKCLENTIKDIQELINAASKVIDTPFELKMIKK